MALIALLPWLLALAGFGGLFVAEHLFPQSNLGKAVIAFKQWMREIDDEIFRR